MNDQSEESISAQPPFPALKISSGSLEGMDFFASWQGFKANDEALHGALRIAIILADADDQRPTEAQTNAYRYLKENEALVRDGLLAGLFADYPQIREVYGGLDPEFLPVIEEASDFRHLIKPLNIYINAEEKDGYAYVGFELDCLWDIEHGLGVMMHQSEYVGCNDAEAAWNLDLAQS